MLETTDFLEGRSFAVESSGKALEALTDQRRKCEARIREDLQVDCNERQTGDFGCASVRQGETCSSLRIVCDEVVPRLDRK